MEPSRDAHANLKHYGTFLPFPLMKEPQPGPTTGAKFERLVEIMAKLRAPGGCPWDREQTFDTIKKYTLEETYEVLDAIDARDWAGLREELGDFLLQAVFFAEMAAEQGLFTIGDSIDAINEKLIRRHPHEIKSEEKRKAGTAPKGLLDGVSRKAPALVEAQQIASKAASVGFDWENAGQVYEKLDEEVAELRLTKDAVEAEDELGDLLFVIVNLARFLKVDPEQALRRANAKFRRRFDFVEQRLREQGKELEAASVAEMEEHWQDAKRVEKAAAPA
jgi:tetrapyrrole methylase family protein / MazG family protein